MLIRVKLGKIEVEYSEPTNSSDYPKCTSRDKTPEISGAQTKHDALLKTIKEMADTVVAMYNNTDGQL